MHKAHTEGQHLQGAPNLEVAKALRQGCQLIVFVMVFHTLLLRSRLNIDYRSTCPLFGRAPNTTFFLRYLIPGGYNYLSQGTRARALADWPAGV